MRPFSLILSFLQFQKQKVNFFFICFKNNLRATVSNSVAGTLLGPSRPGVEVSFLSSSLNLSSIFHVTTPHLPPKHFILNLSLIAVRTSLSWPRNGSIPKPDFNTAGSVQISGRPFSELSQLLSTLEGNNDFRGRAVFYLNGLRSATCRLCRTCETEK